MYKPRMAASALTVPRLASRRWPASIPALCQFLVFPSFSCIPPGVQPYPHTFGLFVTTEVAPHAGSFSTFCPHGNPSHDSVAARHEHQLPNPDSRSGRAARAIKPPASPCTATSHGPQLVLARDRIALSPDICLELPDGLPDRLATQMTVWAYKCNQGRSTFFASSLRR